MARIDWAFVCELAYFDRQERLCVVGVYKQFIVPQLPLLLHQVTLVARLADIHMTDEVDVAVGVVTPSGAVATPTNANGAILEVSGDYILATLRDIPLMEEGPHGFRIALSDQAPVTIDVPVMNVTQPADAEIH